MSVPNETTNEVTNFNQMLAEMLLTGAVVLNTSSTIDMLVVPHHSLHYEGVIDYTTVAIDELDILHKMWERDREFGAIYWCLTRDYNGGPSAWLKGKLQEKGWNTYGDWKSTYLEDRSIEWFILVRDDSDNN